jgi:hypothetical protein
MNDEKQKRRGGWYWWALLLPVFYVLSTGPVTKIWFELEAADYDMVWVATLFPIIYAPLQWAHDNNDQASQFLQWYLHDLWQVYS